MTCASCQRPIADGSNFCPFCGGVQPAKISGAPPTDAGGGAGAAGVLPAPGATAPEPGWSAPPGVPAANSNRASLAIGLGIGGIIFDLGGACCCGVPALLGIGMGIAAFILGGHELEDIRGGFAPASNEGTAKMARILGGIGIPLGMLTFLASVGLMVLGALNNPPPH